VPIIDLQRRLREAGRIRIGEQVPTSNGKTRPAKIDVFRLTCADERSIRAAAELYGGECHEWEGAPVDEQWELKTEAKALDVIVPPVDLAFSQWMELWSGGGCVRRCDGQTNVLNNSRCTCDPDEPDCKPTTRLGVILADLEGIGVWRLETKGWNAAQELLGTIEVLRTLQSRGAMVPARLLLEQRQSKKDGKTRNFAVPVLDLHLSVSALTSGSAGQLAAPAPRLAAGVTPIPRDESPAPSVGEQVRAVETPPERPRRANAATPLPPTGLAPRTAAATVNEDTNSAPSATPVTPPTPSTRATDDRTPGGASMKSMRRLFALMNGNKAIDKDRKERLLWAESVICRSIGSFDDLTQAEVTKLNDVAEGRTPPVADEPQYSDEPF